MIRAARQFAVPIQVLFSVGLSESGRKGALQPYAMNIDGASYFAASARDAIIRFEKATRDGARFIDVGCMQINHLFHGHKFASLNEMLVPSRNVDYAASFLKELYKREGSWTKAVARYHAGPKNHPAQRRYICRVISNMVTSGLGGWTPAARDFCHAQ